jgi:hypothetical protein
VPDAEEDSGFLDFQLDFPHGTEVEYAIAVLLMITGLVFVFFGARLFRWTLAIFTFIAVTAVVYLLVMLISEKPLVSLLSGLGAGLLFALLVIKLWKLALFFVGASVGFIIWVAFNSLFPDVIQAHAVLYGLLAVLMIAFGVLAVLLEQLWLLLATPIVGAFLVIQAADVFIKDDLNVFQVVTDHEQCHSRRTCFILYGVLATLAVIGYWVQIRYTSKYAKNRKKRRELRRDSNGNNVQMTHAHARLGAQDLDDIRQIVASGQQQQQQQPRTQAARPQGGWFGPQNGGASQLQQLQLQNQQQQYQLQQLQQQIVDVKAAARKPPPPPSQPQQPQQQQPTPVWRIQQGDLSSSDEEK